MLAFISLSLVVCCMLFATKITWALCPTPMKSSLISRSRSISKSYFVSNNLLTRYMSTSSLGDDWSEEASINVLETVSDKVKKYSLECTISSSNLSTIFTVYTNEMARRKVQMKGFRPGKMPPSAKKDVCKFVVDYGIEQILKSVSEEQGLRWFHDAECAEPLTVDFDRIVPVAEDGQKYSDRRNTWTLGQSFAFKAELYGQDVKSAASVAPTV